MKRAAGAITGGIARIHVDVQFLHATKGVVYRRLREVFAKTEVGLMQLRHGVLRNLDADTSAVVHHLLLHACSDAVILRVRLVCIVAG